MSKKPSEYKQALKILDDLHRKYPFVTIGEHISIAFDGYGDLAGVSAKEFVFALDKYALSLEINEPISSDEEIEQIIEDGKNLDKMIFDDDEDEEDEYETGIENY